MGGCGHDSVGDGVVLDLVRGGSNGVVRKTGSGVACKQIQHYIDVPTSFERCICMT
jgi:hypothetical protein